MMAKELMPWAQELAHQFRRDFGNRGCTCFINPPCSHCTHEGNPLNLEYTDDAWGEIHDVMAAEAKESIAAFIDELAAQHLSEMKLHIRYTKKVS